MRDEAILIFFAIFYTMMLHACFGHDALRYAARFDAPCCHDARALLLSARVWLERIVR